MKLISVIVPAYNVRPYLERCINSIIHQTYPNLEIILVDDGSTDGTGALCDEIAGRDSRVIVIHKENGGQADARNRGIEIASGEFISFIDADDYIESDMYEQMAAALEEDIVSLVSVGIIKTETTGQNHVISASEKTYLTKEEALMNLFEEGELLPSSSNKLFRKNLFDNVRYVNGIINEDTEIIFRIVDICNQILLLDRAAYHYVLRDGSTTRSDFGLKDYNSLVAYKSAIEVCKKNYPDLLPYAYYYELREYYNAQVRLTDSVNYPNLKKEAFILRIKIVKDVIKCLQWKQITCKYSREMLIYMLTAFWGYRITNWIMMNRCRK